MGWGASKHGDQTFLDLTFGGSNLFVHLLGKGGGQKYFTCLAGHGLVCFLMSSGSIYSFMDICNFVSFLSICRHHSIHSVPAS